MSVLMSFHITVYGYVPRKKLCFQLSWYVQQRLLLLNYSCFLGSGPGGADDLWFHTGRFSSVSVRPYVPPFRPQILPLRPQIRPLWPQIRLIRPLWPQIRPFRPQIRPLWPQIRPLRLQIRPLRPKILPLRIWNLETGENRPVWNHRSSAPPGPLLLHHLLHHYIHREASGTADHVTLLRLFIFLSHHNFQSFY